MRKVKIISLVIFALSLIFCVTACSSENSKELLCNSWYKEGGDKPFLTIYTDGTYEKSNEYGTGKWSVVNDNQLKLTDFYGESDIYDIESVNKDTLVLSGTTYYSTPQPKENTSNINSVNLNSQDVQASNEDNSVPTPSKLLKSLDVFDGLEIVYTGVSPYLSVSTDSTKCSDIVNRYITFDYEKDYVRNGDVVTITAVYNAYDLEEEGYTVTTKTKECKVSGQPEFVTSLDGLDTTALLSEMDDKLASATAANEGDMLFAGVGIQTGYGIGTYQGIQSKTLKSVYLRTLKTNFEGNYPKSPYNCYMRIYEYDIIRKDGKDNTKVYVMVYANNIRQNADGSLSWDLELQTEGYDNYDSMVNDFVTSYRDTYNVTEIQA